MSHEPTIAHNCTHPRLYCARFDAYYCKVCDEWLEGRCRDPACEFCKDRPEKPSEMDEK